MLQQLIGLQITKPRSVWRGDVQGYVISKCGKPRNGDMIILNRVGAGFIGTDINPENCWAVLFRSQISRGIFDTVSIEPVAVDHGFIGRQTKHPWPRVSGLRQGCDSADFNMAKPKAHSP